jgi:hypothetical protein
MADIQARIAQKVDGLRADARRYRSVLSDNGALFFGRGSISMSGMHASHRIPQIYSIVTSAKTHEEKVRELVDRSLLGSMDMAAVFVNGFKDSDALEKCITDFTSGDAGH